MIDVESVLEKLAEIGLIRTHRISGDYYTIYCPFHNHGNERRPSCGVLLHDIYKGGRRYPAGFCHCFTCSYANSLELFISDLLKQANISMSGLEWLKNNIPGFVPESEYDSLVPQDTMDALQSKFAISYLDAKKHNTQPTYVSEEELASYRYTVPYMYQRKLTDAVIAEYDVGFDPNWIPPGRKNPVPCITFPVRDIDGNTLFLCRRSIEGKLYNYPEAVEKPVYGLDRIPEGCKSIVVCESCINALTARVYGYNAVALLGTGNSLQIQQLKQLYLNEVVVCTDGDAAGHRAAAKLRKALSKTFMVWTIPMPDGKDLNDLSKSEFDELYAMRE